MHNVGDHDIHATQLLPTGGAGNLIRVQDSIWNQTWPSISKSNGGGPSATQRWGIVWQETTHPGNEDIFGAMMYWHGGLVSWNGATVIPIDYSNFSERPQVGSPTLPAADGSRQLMVVWNRNTNAGDIAAACIDQDGGILGTGNLNRLQRSSGGRRG